MKPAQEILHTWLRWSERYTRTDMVYLAHGGFWLAVERASAVVAGFLMAVAFANLLEPEKYGVYKYVLSATGLIGAFCLAGMLTAVNRAVARGYEGSLEAGYAAYIRWSFPAIAIGLALAAYYFVHGNATLGISFLIGGSLTPSIGAAALYDNFLAGRQLFSVKALYGALRNSIPPLALIATLMVSRDPVILCAVYFISTGAVTYYCYLEVRKRFVTNNRVDEETLNYSKHLSIINIMGVIAAQADRILVFVLLGGTPLAMYAIAETIPDQIRSLSAIMGSLILPKLSQRPLAELKRELPRKAFIMFLFSTAFALIYILLAPIFFHVFFPKYLDAIVYSQVYALTILVIPSTLFINVFYAHALKRQLYTQRIVSSVTEIVLLVVLIHLYGIWGAIVATLITYLISNMLLLWQFNKVS